VIFCRPKTNGPTLIALRSSLFAIRSSLIVIRSSLFADKKDFPTFAALFIDQSINYTLWQQRQISGMAW
jgi:hypothetical protein